MAKNIFTSYNAGLPYQWSLDDVASQKVLTDPIKEKERLDKKAEGMALNKGDDAYINNMKPMISQQSGNTYTIPLLNPDADGIDYLSQLLTTPEQEAEYRKDNINAQKIALIGDALRQVGNVITTSKGAVPQQFSASPVVGLAAEYKADKAKRDANNLRYYSAKQQERIAEAKNALAKMELDNKRNWENIKFQWEMQKQKEAKEEKERERKHKSEEAQKGRTFTAEQNKLNRENATRNAYIRSNGSSNGAGSGRYMMSPDGIWSRKTSLDSNELESAKAMLIKNGYTLPIDPMYSAAYLAAKQNNNFQEMQVLESIGEEKTRDAIMQIMSQDANAAKLIGERFGFTFMPSSNTTNNNSTTNNANANTSSGGMVSKEPVMPTPIWGKTESGKDENGKEDLRDLLGTKG
jgi:hypothetical protein